MSTPFNLRPATSEDVEAVHRIHTEAIRADTSEHYAPEAVEVWVGAFNRDNFPKNIQRLSFLVAESGKARIDGFLAVDLETGEVDSVYVAPWSQGRGLGALLLSKAEELAVEGGHSEIWLDSSLNAVGFYERHGWLEVERHSRVRKGVEIPVVRMGKTL
jgi:ribosomal protein S18 acetylase RimI-like enzyme